MRLLSSNNIRWFFFQLLALVVVFLFASYIYHNASSNIENRDLQVGFDFLSAEAGFYIAESLIDYQESDSYAKVFLVGIINTLYVSIIAIIFSSIIGLIIGVARFSNNWLIRKISSAYIEFFRNIPVLLQIIFWHILFINFAPSVKESANLFDLFYFNSRGFFTPKILELDTLIYLLLASILVILLLFKLFRFKHKFSKLTYWAIRLVLLSIPPLLYYFLGGLSLEIPKLTGFNFQGGFSVSPEFFSLALGLSIYTATYIAEAVRSGIESVSKGQKEAALSLGLTQKQSLKLVILPQALRVAVPPIISQYLNATKNSSLAVAIGYPDLVNIFTGTTLNQVGQALEIIAMTMLVYLCISLFISLILNWVNAKLAIKEH